MLIHYNHQFGLEWLCTQHLKNRRTNQARAQLLAVQELFQATAVAFS
ncbi:hypothetical protein HHC26_08030 [Neisseria meningitidis]|nr:hypothetical protein [Neisseria meningitidis]